MGAERVRRGVAATPVAVKKSAEPELSGSAFCAACQEAGRGFAAAPAAIRGRPARSRRRRSRARRSSARLPHPRRSGCPARRRPGAPRREPGGNFRRQAELAAAHRTGGTGGCGAPRTQTCFPECWRTGTRRFTSIGFPRPHRVQRSDTQAAVGACHFSRGADRFDKKARRSAAHVRQERLQAGQPARQDGAPASAQHAPPGKKRGQEGGTPSRRRRALSPKPHASGGCTPPATADRAQ